ncbi:MAG TPA: S41 family peptidase, partial [Pyrinomonadaceae bacterium]|nr:S41 family peptidase [Pyrinomonadaceae bacterium]
FGKGLVQKVFQLPFNTGLTLTTARYYTPYGRSLQRDYSNGSLYDYYTRHDEDEKKPAPAGSPSPKGSASPVTETSPSPHPPSGPAVKTAAGRVFYGGGGITPDIDVKPLLYSPVRNRIAEAAFQFTRRLAAGLLPGLEGYKVEKVQYGRNPRTTDYAINEQVVEAFRSFIRTDTQSQLTAAQLDAELDFVKLRLREEIVTAAYSNDAGARVLLDSDPQVLRALEALPEAKRLAESLRTGVISS